MDNNERKEPMSIEEATQFAIEQASQEELQDQLQQQQHQNEQENTQTDDVLDEQTEDLTQDEQTDDSQDETADQQIDETADQQIDETADQQTDETTDQQTDETADQQTNEQQNDIQAIIDQNRQLMEQNKQLVQLITEQSQAAKEKIQDNVLNPTQEVQEEVAENNEAFLDQFYENPKEAIAKLVMNELQKSGLTEVKQAYQQDMERQEWEQALSAVANDKERFPRFEELKDEIGDILQKNPSIGGNKVEKVVNAYFIANGLKSQQPDIKQQLQDDNFLQELVQDKDFIKKIAMLQAKQNKSQQVPPFAASTGAANAAPHIPNKPTTIEEATEILKKKYNF